MNKIDNYAEEFSFLDGEERLVHLIDLAKRPTNLPEEMRTDSRKVHGCVSQIWVDVGLKDDLVNVYYDSDAMITKGICTENITPWAGLRPMTPNMMPIVKQSKNSQRIFYNTGHGHLGWTLSAFTAREIVNKIKNRKERN